MPKYKNIKGVAHNLGHSFLSDMNFVGTGRALTMVPEALYEAAKQVGQPLIRIDLLTGRIEPEAVATKPVKQSVANYVRWLPKLATSQSVEPGMIQAATLNLRFDFAASRPSKYSADREIPAVECVVQIVDNRGVQHEAQPVNWPYD